MHPASPSSTSTHGAIFNFNHLAMTVHSREYRDSESTRNARALEQVQELPLLLHHPFSQTTSTEVINEIFALPPYLTSPFPVRRSSIPLPPLEIIDNLLHQSPSPQAALQHDINYAHFPASLDPACVSHRRVDKAHRIIVLVSLHPSQTMMEMVFCLPLCVSVFVPVESWRRRTLQCEDIKRAAIRAVERACERDPTPVIARQFLPAPDVEAIAEMTVGAPPSSHESGADMSMESFFPF